MGGCAVYAGTGTHHDAHVKRQFEMVIPFQTGGGHVDGKEGIAKAGQQRQSDSEGVERRVFPHKAKDSDDAEDDSQGFRDGELLTEKQNTG